MRTSAEHSLVRRISATRSTIFYINASALISNPFAFQRSTRVQRSSGAEQNENENEKKKMKSQRFALCLWFSFALAFQPAIATADNSTFRVEHFGHKLMAYVETIGRSKIVNGDWNLLVFYDLKKFFDAFNAISGGVSELKQQCIDMKFNCTALVTQFEDSLASVRIRNEFLLNKPAERRSKRNVLAAIGLGGLAIGGGALFSWLTSSDSDEYATAINELNTNQKQMWELLKNQTSFLDMSYTYSKQIEEVIEMEKEYFRNATNVLIQSQQNSSQVQNIALQYSLMLTKYEEVQTRLITTASSIQRGKLDPELVSPLKMAGQMSFIHAHLGPDFELPKLRHVYRFSTVKTQLIGDKMLFHVAIPVIRVSSFKLWRIIPIPTRASANTFVEIRPPTEFLLVSETNETYYEMQTSDLEMCGDMDDTLLCRIRHPSYKFGNDTGRCEMELIHNSNSTHSNCKLESVSLTERWTQLNNIHMWIFALDAERQYNVSCNDFTKTIVLRGTGSLYLSGNCSFVGEDIQISTHQLETQLTTGYFVSVNISLDFNRTVAIDEMLKTKVDTKVLETALSELKGKSSGKLIDANVPVHIWRRYGMFLGFIFGLLVYFAVRRLRNKMAYGDSTVQKIIIQA